jgi:DNA polymerase-4
VQGSGLRRVTVRFEEPTSPPGRVRTFWMDDPDLELSEPLPLVAPPDDPDDPDGPDDADDVNQSS